MHCAGRASSVGFLTKRVRRTYGRRRRSIVPVLQRASALPLAKQSIGITARLWPADVLKSFRCILAQGEARSAKVAVQMLDRACTDDRGDDAWPVCDPAQCDLRRRCANLFRNANDGVDCVPVAIGVCILFGNRLVEGFFGTGPRVCRRLAATLVLAGEEAASKRRPRQQ